MNFSLVYYHIGFFTTLSSCVTGSHNYYLDYFRMKAIINHQDSITKDKPGSAAEPQFFLNLALMCFTNTHPFIIPDI